MTIDPTKTKIIYQHCHLQHQFVSIDDKLVCAKRQWLYGF